MMKLHSEEFFNFIIKNNGICAEGISGIHHCTRCDYRAKCNSLLESPGGSSEYHIKKIAWSKAELKKLKVKEILK